MPAEIKHIDSYKIKKEFFLNCVYSWDNESFEVGSKSLETVYDEILKYILSDVRFILKLCVDLDGADIFSNYKAENEEEARNIDTGSNVCTNLLDDLDLETSFIQHTPEGAYYTVTGSAGNLISFMEQYTNHFDPNGFADDGSAGEYFREIINEFENYLDCLSRGTNADFQFNHLHINRVNEYRLELKGVFTDPDEDDYEIDSLEELRDFFLNDYSYFRVLATFPQGGIDDDDMETYHEDITEEEYRTLDSGMDTLYTLRSETLDLYFDFEDQTDEGAVYTIRGKPSEVIRFLREFRYPDFRNLNHDYPEPFVQDADEISRGVNNFVKTKRLGFFNEDINMKLDLLQEELTEDGLKTTFGITYEELEKLADENGNDNWYDEVNDTYPEQFMLRGQEGQYPNADNTGVVCPGYDNCGGKHFDSLKEMCDYYSEEFIKEGITQFLDWCEEHGFYQKPKKKLGFFSENMNMKFDLLQERIEKNFTPQEVGDIMTNENLSGDQKSQRLFGRPEDYISHLQYFCMDGKDEVTDYLREHNYLTKQALQLDHLTARLHDIGDEGRRDADRSIRGNITVCTVFYTYHDEFTLDGSWEEYVRSAREGYYWGNYIKFCINKFEESGLVAAVPQKKLGFFSENLNENINRNFTTDEQIREIMENPELSLEEKSRRLFDRSPEHVWMFGMCSYYIPEQVGSMTDAKGTTEDFKNNYSRVRGVINTYKYNVVHSIGCTTLMCIANQSEPLNLEESFEYYVNAHNTTRFYGSGCNYTPIHWWKYLKFCVEKFEEIAGYKGKHLGFFTESTEKVMTADKLNLGDVIKTRTSGSDDIIGTGELKEIDPQMGEIVFTITDQHGEVYKNQRFSYYDLNRYFAKDYKVFEFNGKPFPTKLGFFDE